MKLNRSVSLEWDELEPYFKQMALGDVLPAEALAQVFLPDAVARVDSGMVGGSDNLTVSVHYNREGVLLVALTQLGIIKVDGRAGGEEWLAVKANVAELNRAAASVWDHYARGQRAAASDSKSAAPTPTQAPVSLAAAIESAAVVAVAESEAQRELEQLEQEMRMLVAQYTDPDMANGMRQYLMKCLLAFAIGRHNTCGPAEKEAIVEAIPDVPVLRDSRRVLQLYDIVQHEFPELGPAFRISSASDIEQYLSEVTQPPAAAALKPALVATSVADPAPEAAPAGTQLESNVDVSGRYQNKTLQRTLARLGKEGSGVDLEFSPARFNPQMHALREEMRAAAITSDELEAREKLAAAFVEQPLLSVSDLLAHIPPIHVNTKTPTEE